MRWRRIVLWLLLAIVALPAGYLLGHRQAAPVRLPPFLCYLVPNDNSMMGKSVKITDQFNEKPTEATFTHLNLVCTPVTKKELPPGRIPVPVQQGDHLLCYKIEGGKKPKNPRRVFDDQFGRHEFDQPYFDLRESILLCEPADKIVEF